MTALHPDGYQAAYVGVVEVDGVRRPLYARNIIIDILMDRDEMTEEEAEEFFDYNVAGSYVGPEGPAYACLEPGEVMSPEDWQYKLFLMGKSATADLHPTQAADIATAMKLLLVENKLLQEENARLKADAAAAPAPSPVGKKRSRASNP